MPHDFKVQANANSLTGGTPLSTGIKLKPGNLLVVTASPSDTWSAGRDNRTGNANGLGNTLGGSFGYYSNGAQSFLYGSLVGTLDDGKTYFGVGTYLAMTILTDGELKFVYWDLNNADNKDFVTATVQVYNGPNP